MSDDNEVPKYERNLEITPEQEAIAAELVSFWQAQQHRPVIIHELTDPMGSKLGTIEARLRKLSDRERTVLHLATGPLRWPRLDKFFGRLAGVALGTDAMLREFPRRKEKAILDQRDWLCYLDIRADKGDDTAAQILADIAADALKDFKNAVSNYARTRLTMIAGRHRP